MCLCALTGCPQTPKFSVSEIVLGPGLPGAGEGVGWDQVTVLPQAVFDDVVADGPYTLESAESAAVAFASEYPAPQIDVTGTLDEDSPSRASAFTCTPTASEGSSSDPAAAFVCDAWGSLTFSESEVDAATELHVHLFQALNDAQSPLVTVDVQLADVEYDYPTGDSFSSSGGVDQSSDTHGAVLYVNTERWFQGYR